MSNNKEKLLINQEKNYSMNKINYGKKDKIFKEIQTTKKPLIKIKNNLIKN